MSWDVVVTAKDLAEDERLMLCGHVERVIQKGAYSRQELLAEVRHLLNICLARPEEK